MYFYNNDPRYFINEFQLGIGAEVVKTVTGKMKRYGKKFAFGIGALRTLINYKKTHIEFTLDEKTEISAQLLGIIIANGSLTGGGMRLTPDAKLDDGYFDLLAIPDMDVFKRFKTFSKIYSSGFSSVNGFKYHRAKKIEFNRSKEFKAEADGELIADVCTSVCLVPSVLKVCTIPDGVNHG
jgi:diacylglycerol kinase (ATP)